MPRTTTTEKIADETAVIYNFSGHKIPQSAFEKLKARGYKKWVIFNRSIHVNMDADVPTQIKKDLDLLFTTGNKEGDLPQTVEGDRYYICSGHAAANLLIYTALSSIFGTPPLLLLIGNNEKSWNSYELKDILTMKSWKGSWRSEMRQRYTLLSTEVVKAKESEETPDKEQILEHRIRRPRSSSIGAQLQMR